MKLWPAHYRCVTAPVRAFLTALTGAGLWVHHVEWWLFAGGVVATALALVDVVPACRRPRPRLAAA